MSLQVKIALKDLNLLKILQNSIWKRNELSELSYYDPICFISLFPPLIWLNEFPKIRKGPARKTEDEIPGCRRLRTSGPKIQELIGWRAALVLVLDSAADRPLSRQLRDSTCVPRGRWRWRRGRKGWSSRRGPSPSTGWWPWQHPQVRLRGSLHTFSQRSVVFEISKPLPFPYTLKILRKCVRNQVVSPTRHD